MDTLDLVRLALRDAGHVGLDIAAGLGDIAGNIEGVTGSLGDGKTVVESNAARDGTETDDDTPHLVSGEKAITLASALALGRLEGALETSSDNQSDDTSEELADTLHGEDGTHHGSSPLGGRELGSDNRRERVVTTDTDTHENTPEDDNADN